MPRRPPMLATILGFAGLIPFLGLGLAAVSTDDVLRAELLTRALVGYGAVILAFLGGVQWGFVLSPLPADRDVRTGRVSYRLVLGVTPSLIGWIAVLLALVGPNPAALAVLLAGLVALVAAEADLNRRGLLPPGYMLLRWMLSVVVALLLATVLVLRLLGAHVNF